jgi:DNA-binding MarR family transcriptional regulator
MQLLPKGIKKGTAVDMPEAASADCAGAVLNVAPPVVRAIRKMMRDHRLSELSVPQFRALGLLIRSPEASLSMVADYVGSSLPAASRMIDGLVAKNLVARKECCRDRRQVSLELTPLGRSAFLESRQATRRQLAQRLAGLSATQRQTVMDAMRSLGEVFGSDAELARRVGAKWAGDNS